MSPQIQPSFRLFVAKITTEEVNESGAWEKNHTKTSGCRNVNGQLDCTKNDFRLSSSENFLSLQCFDAVGWAAGRASGL